MTRIHGVVAAGLLTLAGGIGIGVGRAQQDQGPSEKAGSKLDEAGRSFKKGLEDARDAVRNQFARARGSVHNMDVASRVYGRLHWDKTLTTSTLDLDVKSGVATLRGAVPDARAKAKAVELAEDTVGISKVIDQLTIQAAAANDPRCPLRYDAQVLIRAGRGESCDPRGRRNGEPRDQSAREAAEIVNSVNRPPFRSIVRLYGRAKSASYSAREPIQNHVIVSPSQSPSARCPSPTRAESTGWRGLTRLNCRPGWCGSVRQRA